MLSIIIQHITSAVIIEVTQYYVFDGSLRKQPSVVSTVISGLLSAPEYKPHPLNLKKIIILNINKPHMSISRRCLPVH